MSHSVLVVNASVQQEASISRKLVDELLHTLSERGEVGPVVERDLSTNEVRLISAEHVAAYYTDPDDRSAEQHRLLSQSDDLVAELKAADTLIVGAPMYNFSVPASLKAWIDLVCRVGETFRYTENGPEGLSGIKRAYLVVATGGTPIGSEADFLVPYLKQVMRFIGVEQVEVIAADKVKQEEDKALAEAREQIEAA